MANLPNYQYAPLSTKTSIRIVILLPNADKSAHLECRIEETDINDPKKYYAVSYVWGDESEPSTIQCGDAYISITRNLDAALRRFRQDSDEMPLWVDSIAINQNDIAELNAQVSIMGAIYRKTDIGLIWLGEENEYEDTEAAFQGLSLILNKVWPREEEITNWYIQYQDNDDEELSKDIFNHFNLPSYDSSQIAALAQFFLCRPWFQRAWTYQESFLPPRRILWCGPYVLLDWDLCRAAILLQQLLYCSDKLHLDLYHLFHVTMMIGPDERMSRNGLGHFLTLSELLSIRRGSGCKNPRDQVYSLIGAMSDKIDIFPDYEKSCEMIYAEVVYKVIQYSGNLRVFSHLDIFLLHPHLPSWVPNWAKKRIKTQIYLTYPLQKTLYRSTGSSIANVSMSSDSKELTIRGIAFDRIKSKESCTSMPTPDYLSIWIQKFFVIPWNLEPVYKYTMEPIEDAIHRTIDTDLEPTNLSSEPVKRQSPEYKNAKMATSKSSLGSRKFYSHSLGDKAFRSALIVTDSGRIGNAPVNVEPGDVVALLLGGEVPIILRPNLNGKFLVVGECYLHGFMDGEGLVEARKKADATYDENDTTWIKELHKSPMPLPFQDFVLV